jgi:metal-responsive CopG/Arc/MetJ family transcriptional regulator
MKQRINITINDESLSRLDKWTEIEGINRSEGLERIISKLDFVGQNLSKFIKIISYDPQHKGACLYNKDNMDIILEHFKNFTDAQHFINTIVVKYVNQAIQETITQETQNKYTVTDDVFGKVNPAMREFMEKQSKKIQGKMEVGGFDSNGEPTY